MSDVNVGDAALQIWEALQSENVLCLADDDLQAQAIATGLAALTANTPVIFIPSSDRLPGDKAPASPANIGQRIAALRRLREVRRAHSSPLAVVMSGEAAAWAYAAARSFDAAPPILSIEDAIDPDRFAAEVQALGYVIDERVDEPGEVAVRGEVIDIFPVDAGSPARIDVRDGKIAGIRCYEPATQLSSEPLDRLEIGRAVEPAAVPGISIFDHLPSGVIFVTPKGDKRRTRHVQFVCEMAPTASDEIIGEEDWSAARAHWSEREFVAGEGRQIPFFAQRSAPLAALARFVKPLLAEGRKFVLVGSARDLRFLQPRLAKKLAITIAPAFDLAAACKGSQSEIATIVAPIDKSARHENIVMIAAADILGSRARLAPEPERMSAGLDRASGEIRSGDIVIHEDHGVGRIAGLETAQSHEEGGELISLEYAKGARRFVPLREAGKLWRYAREADTVTLDRLDGVSWAKRRTEIDQAIGESARALLALAEERTKQKAPVIEPDASRYERFAHDFTFSETVDQAKAIQAVRDDLAREMPMDRLVIGDVGFGKTEVAIRAAALAAFAGYQVVIAAPTTVLASQHLQTFARRFAKFDIRVAGLSRLSTPAEKRAVKDGLADGSIHIVVGTAAILAKDVAFANLGCVIIDEEQRFGVADKQRLRRRPDIHFLAMSATPIPRTLHRAMIGLQQISIIATPPARRQPVRTSVLEADDNHIRTALQREHARGGQSFIVVPRIEDLAPVRDRIRRLAPDLSVLEAHGKLPAADVDAAMVRFGDGEGDVLLATNIIEAGLDVPRANTMIIWRADRFGLAQLHQLRGRVGRGSRRGQVLLMTDGEGLAERTLKRLRTLTTYDQLGAGFEISISDLDRRGAGDPLSDTQAGHMKLIGVDLYQHLFAAVLRHMADGSDTTWNPDIRVGAVGQLPPDWIPDADLRLGLYIRLGHAPNLSALDMLRDELEDRFGALPDDAETLLTATRAALLARKARIARVDAGPAAIALTPREPREPPAGIGLEVKDDRWLLRERTSDEDRGDRVADLLERLLDEKR